MTTLEPITVSSNGRFLMTASSQPFFWLGDTAWELFHRLNRQQAEHYLENRRQRGFNVIQAVALAEFDGLGTPNANGHTPLCGDDPTRPNEFYFRYIDEIIRLAAAKGLYIGLLPTWGDKVNGNLWGAGPVVFNPENARIYGQYLGQRYRNDSNILWILGGDRPATGYEDVWAAMAEGITDGLGRRPLFTYHPSGGQSSSAWLAEAAWLDMHMLQSGHSLLDAPNWEMISADYQRQPVKPVLDGEPNYEDHPIDPWSRPWQPAYGRFTDYDVRKQAYRAVFSGACGHTYGHHSIWQFWELKREPINYPMPTWDEAILRPGSAQLIHLKNLLLGQVPELGWQMSPGVKDTAQAYFNRIPDQGLLPEQAPTQPAGPIETDRYNPQRAAYACATRDEGGSYAFVYIPQAGQTVTVDLGRLMAGKDTRPTGRNFQAAWYDPRNGKVYTIGDYSSQARVQFTTPIAGPDWVLVFISDNNR